MLWGTSRFFHNVYVRLEFVNSLFRKYTKAKGKDGRQFKIIVEKYSDGYVAYLSGLKGIVVGEGDTYEEALNDVRLTNRNIHSL